MFSKIFTTIKKLFHKHDFKITEYSNIIQYDDMGYPLRLFIERCDCGECKQSWIDITESAVRKTDAVCKWYKSINKPVTPASQLASISGD